MLEEVAVAGTLPLLGALLVLMPWIAADTDTPVRQGIFVGRQGPCLNERPNQSAAYGAATSTENGCQGPCWVTVYCQHAMQSWEACSCPSTGSLGRSELASV